ncbi:MAG: phage protease [Zoogloeaceae bacterium]|jgi:phage I-like protein|nr:phage protease [Zoogloeaceae bacterium]
MPQAFQTACLAFEIEQKPDYPEGCNAHLFPDGEFQSNDGRPGRNTDGRLTHWLMDAPTAAALIARFEASGRPILYDYEHRSANGWERDTRAAGWIDQLHYEPGKGLFAHVQWSAQGKADIEGLAYRYTSPAFRYDQLTGAVVDLLSVALTNDPALSVLSEVALQHLPHDTAESRRESANAPQPQSIEGENAMSDKETAALTAERDTLKTQVAELTKQRDEATAKLAALEAQRIEEEQAKAEAERAALLEKLAQKQPPAVVALAKQADMAALKAFVDAAEPAELLTRQGEARQGKPAAATLTADEAAFCAKLNVTPEQFLKAKE